MVTPRRNCAASDAVWNAIRDVFTISGQQALGPSEGSITLLNSLLRLSQFMIAGVVPGDSDIIDMFPPSFGVLMYRSELTRVFSNVLKGFFVIDSCGL